MYCYALLVIDQGSGSTSKEPSQTPETMGRTKTKVELVRVIEYTHMLTVKGNL